jgi:hypothetical protein
LVGEQKVADLPLNGRNYIDLTLLQPGITQHKDMGLQPTSGGLWFSSNGAPLRSNNYMLDGAMLVNMQGINSSGITGSTLGVDGIREYRVITNSFSAEYGMKMGSQVTMVSKNGTNSFHGDGFEYLRNSAMDARNFFDLKSAATGPNFRLPPLKRNQFGGSVGGPIRKDKTFFYAVYEGLRQRLGISTNAIVPGAGCHGPAGAVITNTACPQLGTVSSVTISPVNAPLLAAAYPLPNLGATNYTFPFTQPTRDDYGQMRVDQTISSNDSLFGRFTIDDTQQLGLVANQQYPQNSLATQSRNQFSTLSENHIFSAAVLNTARFSFSRTAPLQASTTTVTGPQVAYIQSQLNSALQTGITNVGGLTSFGPTSPQTTPQNIFTWSDDLFYSRGKHSLKFGTLINRYQQYLINESGYRGTATYASLATFLQAQPNTYTAVNLPGSIPERNLRLTTLGFYAQDDFRVLPNLTLNLGLRYEFATQLHDKNGIQASIQDIQHDAAPTVGLMYQNPTLHNFSPRVGFAWDVTGDGKTAVRGGFGEYYDIAYGGTSIDPMLVSMAPFGIAKVVSSPAAGTFTVPFTFPASAASSSVWYFDYHLRQPKLLSYNLTVDRQLPGGMALTLGYAGSRGINLLTNSEGNPTVPNGVPVNGACAARPTGQAYAIGQPFCWLAGAPRTNSHFGSVQYVTGRSNSFYNALQVGLSKQLSHGLQFQTSYTWSRLIDEGQGEASGDTVGSTTYNSFPTIRTIDRGLADFDTTQNLRFNAIYRLPGLTSGNSFVKGVSSGWQASTILSLQSGYPFTPGLQTNRSLSGTGIATSGNTSQVDRPNLVAGRNAANIVSGTTAGCLGVTPGQQLGTPNLYYDPCAFTVPAAGFLGTSGRNILRGPGLANLDFSLVKDTAVKYLGEAGKLEFRAEVFNILNRANFLIPARIVYAGNPVPPATTQAPLANAGVITSTGSATSRQVQLALKIIF